MRQVFNLAIFLGALVLITMAWPPSAQRSQSLEWHDSFKEAYAESLLTRRPLLVSSVEAEDQTAWRNALQQDGLAAELRSCVLVAVDPNEPEPWLEVLGNAPGREHVLLSWRGDVLFSGATETAVEGIPRALDLYRACRDLDHKRFQNFVAMNPEEPQGLFGLGEAKLARGYPHQAAETFKRLLALEPSELTDNAHLAYAAAVWQARGAEEAQGILEVFLDRYPQSEEHNLGRVAYGMLLRELRHTTEAKPYLATPLL